MCKQWNEESPLTDVVHRYGRNQPKIYHIVVGGVVDPGWSERLGGLRIGSKTGGNADEPNTVLEGLIRDQAQLADRIWTTEFN